MTFSFASALWLVLLIAFVIIEAVTAQLVSVWFAVGAAAAFFASALTSSWLVMLSIFVIVSAVSLIFTRPLVRKHMDSGFVPTNADMNVGRIASVIVPITPAAAGRVRLDGVDWAARSNAAIAEGAMCTVLSVDGATLTVQPIEPAVPADQVLPSETV